DVWRTYRMRGDAENRIKELKQDFGAESFNLKDFYATEAALIFSMTAYNLSTKLQYIEIILHLCTMNKIDFRTLSETERFAFRRQA
ncbi:transposase, partial [Tannerella forsythia]|uniref:transposase n=1 Tax=Tannerella forsythia TaxID=28112 RepID=UPI0021AB7E8A